MPEPAEYDWTRVEELFFAAADLPLKERIAFLDHACAGNVALREEVESLLARDVGAEDSIASTVAETAHSLFEDDIVVGSQVGVWRLVREIGRGGMGTVFQAIRDDNQFQQQVAIKIVRRGMDTDDLLSRFRHERQILANLDHPFIARLIDGGNTKDGRPFLVMEFVEGERIDDYCRSRNLDLRDRCRLFVKVGEAVAHAHSQLVVHRDLKPGNILITADGAPKLLDFGVAKIMQADADLSMTSTMSPTLALTPDYASPEQIRGLPAGTASDVYSLGAVLYELLSGTRPHQIRPNSPPHEWERLICETDVIRPGAAATDPKLAKGLSGDLDNIILTAMRKEPTRRYRSVDHFMEDLRAYLEGMPVAARKDSLHYRIQKFAWRQRFALGAAAIVILSLVSGIIVAFSQARKAEAEAQRAQLRLTQMVNLSNRSLSNVYALMERLPGAMPARQELVTTTLEFLEKLSHEAGGDPKLRIALSTAYLRLGDLQGDPEATSLGDMQRALRSYRSAAAILEPLEPAPAPDRLAAWVEVQQRIGKALSEMGDLPGSVAVFRNAIAVSERSRSADAAKDPLRRRANLSLSMSRTLQDSDLPQALEYAEQFLKLVDALCKRFPNDPNLLHDLSIAYTQVGWVKDNMGDPEAAEIHYARMVALREQLVKRYPNDTMFRRTLMLGYEHYGSLQGGANMPFNLGRPDIARQYYEKARPLEEAALSDPDANKYDYALFLLKIGSVEVPASQLDESLVTLRHAASLFEKMSASAPEMLRYKRGLSVANGNIGHCLIRLNRRQEAIAALERSLAVGKQLLAVRPEDRPTLVQSLSSERDLIGALVAEGDRQRALQLARNLVANVEKAVEAGSEKNLRRSYLAQAYLTLATVHRSDQDWNGAQDAARHASTLARALLTGSRHDRMASVLEDALAIERESKSRLIARRQ